MLGLPRLLQTLKAHEEQTADNDPDAAALVKAKFTTPIEEAYTNFTNLVRLVTTAVDLQAAQRYEYLLQPHFSDRLADLDSQREELRVQIEGHHRKLCRDLSLSADTLRLEIDSKFGHVLRVTRKEEASIRSSAAVTSGKVRLNLLQTRKDGVLYHDTVLAAHAEEYADVSKQVCIMPSH